LQSEAHKNESHPDPEGFPLDLFISEAEMAGFEGPLFAGFFRRLLDKVRAIRNRQP